MTATHHRWISAGTALVAFTVSFMGSSGCILGTCEGYCDGFSPRIDGDTYYPQVYDPIDHFASDLDNVEITDDEVVLTYLDLDGQPQEVVWEIVSVQRR